MIFLLIQKNLNEMVLRKNSFLLSKRPFIFVGMAVTLRTRVVVPCPNFLHKKLEKPNVLDICHISKFPGLFF